jgi:hypothetical protein
MHRGLATGKLSALVYDCTPTSSPCRACPVPTLARQRGAHLSVRPAQALAGAPPMSSAPDSRTGRHFLRHCGHRHCRAAKVHVRQLHCATLLAPTRRAVGSHPAGQDVLIDGHCAEEQSNDKTDNGANGTSGQNISASLDLPCSAVTAAAAAERRRAAFETIGRHQAISLGQRSNRQQSKQTSEHLHLRGATAGALPARSPGNRFLRPRPARGPD